MNDIADVHKNYIETYKKYLTIVEESTTILDKEHKIFNEIYRDSIFSRDIRQKLHGLDEYFKVKQIGPLIQSIYEYLEPATDESFIYIDCNASRNNLATGLMLIVENKKNNGKINRRAVERIEQSIIDLQDRYGNIISNSNALKGCLLL